MSNLNTYNNANLSMLYETLSKDNTKSIVTFARCCK